MELDLDVLRRGPLKLNLDVLPKGPLKLNFGRASQRSDGMESWTCFPEVQRLNFGRASQRSMDLNLDMLLKRPRI